MTPLNKIPGAATGHHQDETQISQTQALWFFFVSHSHGWSELKPRSSRNPDPFKQKIKVDQTHSSRSWRRRRGPTGSEWEKKRLIRPIEAEMNEEWERRKKEVEIREKKKWEKRRPIETREKKKINKIINGWATVTM